MSLCVDTYLDIWSGYNWYQYATDWDCTWGTSLLKDTHYVCNTSYGYYNWRTRAHVAMVDESGVYYADPTTSPVYILCA